MYRGISFSHLFLVLQLAQLSAVTKGKTIKIGQEGYSVDLPCQVSKKSSTFTWKFSNQTKILGKTGGLITKGQTLQQPSRFESRPSSWDKGSYPLIISKPTIEDSQTYTCQVDQNVQEVELWVFRVTANPNSRLLQGQSLTFTLASKSGFEVFNPSMQCKGPGRETVKGSKTVSVSNVRIQDRGKWSCTVTLGQEKKEFQISISVLGFQKMSTTEYKREGESVEFSFPLDLGDENLQGELRWKGTASFSQSWITFSLENKKVSVKKSTDNPKLQLAETLPLLLKIPQVSLQHAGSGNLTLTFAKGTLYHEVNLVVMRVAQQDNTLTCEVLGPTSPKMTLTLKQESQEAKVSKEKMVQVLAPEAGVWHCLLSDGDEVKLDSKIQVSSRRLNQDQPMFLAFVLGGTFSFLIAIGLCILCCVRCRHQQRQAERVSQIKRLLSEKKTCQCSHRMQKTQNFI